MVLLTRATNCPALSLLSRRHERLCHWLALETWVGMVVDAMLCSGQDASASQIYKQMLGEAAAGLLDDILAPLVRRLEAVSFTCSY